MADTEWDQTFSHRMEHTGLGPAVVRVWFGAAEEGFELGVYGFIMFVWRFIMCQGLSEHFINIGSGNMCRPITFPGEDTEAERG